jgi:signal transduction histidine kinase
MDWAQNNRLHIVMPTHLYADVDAGLLKTMISNLIDNALAYSPPESVVTLTVQKITSQHPPSWLVLSVSNHVGKAGMPDAQKVFTKYYRAAAAHQRTGSGLGLFLVKNLAEMVEGHLLYRSSPSERVQVVFELHLPLHQHT